MIQTGSILRGELEILGSGHPPIIRAYIYTMFLAFGPVQSSLAAQDLPGQSSVWGRAHEPESWMLEILVLRISPAFESTSPRNPKPNISRTLLCYSESCSGFEPLVLTTR